jgi:hypothetical protein
MYDTIPCPAAHRMPDSFGLPLPALRQDVRMMYLPNHRTRTLEAKAPRILQGVRTLTYRRTGGGESPSGRRAGNWLTT